MFALLYLLTHWSLLNLGEIPADKTCTSLPQAWSVPRGDRIEPEPVMKCSYAQAAADQVGKRKRPPVSCKLYDARSKRIKKLSWKPEIVLNLYRVGVVVRALAFHQCVLIKRHLQLLTL